MTDAFLPPDLAAPPAGAPPAAAGPAPALGPTAATPGDVLKAQGELRKQRPPLVSNDISARDRLIYGAKLLAQNSTANGTVPVPAGEPWEQAQRLTGLPDRLDPKLVNVAARLAQSREGASDPDKIANGWDRVGKNPLVRGKLSESVNRLLAGAALPDDEWETVKLGVQQAADAIEPIGEDARVGAGRVVGVDVEDDGAYLQVDYDDVSDVDGLPTSLTGPSGVALPAHALSKKAGKLTVFAGPSDVVYAGDVNDQNDQALRNFWPGPVGSDGKPRWLPVEPLPVKDHQLLRKATLVEPTSVTEAWADRESYPGTLPGDWISFDVPDDRPWRGPQWAKGSVQVRGGVGRESPAYSLAPVAQDDLADPVVAADRLADSSWAVFVPQGDPKSTAKLIGNLSSTGREPIELKGEQKAWLVFGVTPDEAARLSPKRPVYVNDGLINGDEPDVVPVLSLKTADGSEYTLDLDASPTTVGTPRADTRAVRHLVRVEPTDAKRVARLAEDLELAGASNVSIYSRNQEVDGFVRVREHAYSDGISVQIARTKNTGPALNSVPVYVRSDAGLPALAPDVRSSVVDPVQVDPENPGVVLDADETDLAPVVRQAALINFKYGQGTAKVRTAQGEVKLHA